MKTILQYLKSRTVWLHIIMMGLAMLNAYLELIIEPAYYAAWLVLYGNIGIGLRKLTTKPLDSK